MHYAALGKPRKEVIRQVKEGNASVKDCSSYIPIGNAASKIRKWQQQGASISYLTSRKSAKEVSEIRNVLKRHGFPEGELFYRSGKEEYKDVVLRAEPDILIEDDCESIGADEIIAPKLAGSSIKTIVVREFGGIDHLPDDMEELEKFARLV